MKSFMKSKLLKMLAQGAKSLGAMIQVKLGRPATHHVLRCVASLGRRNNIGVVKVIITYLASLHRLYKRNGMTFVVKTMKSCQVLMMQSLGGQRLYNLNPLGPRLARTKAGLPRVIPALHRVAIRRGDLWTIRLWQSLFGLYRVIEIPGVLKLKTITEPTTMDPELLPEFSNFVSSHFWSVCHRMFRCPLTIASRSQGGRERFLKGLRAKPFLISKSTSAVRKDQEAVNNISPISTSPAGLISSAILWAKSDLAPFFQDWCKMTGNIWMLNRVERWGTPVRDSLLVEKSWVVPNDYIEHPRDLAGPFSLSNREVWDMLTPDMISQSKFPTSTGVSVGSLGRLAALDEPAGKVRVVAMVDAFTQWLFHPLHQRIFDFLRKVPTDGTFDQLRPIERLLKRRPQGPFYSFDLSAATDRLPLQIQKILLSPILTSWGAEVWGTLLVGRPYHILHKDASHLPDIGLGDLRQVMYETGQPMGAYSSWAMLALTHHAIVQWAALRAGVITCGGVFFLDYALLGDDIVIANKLVADEYERLMSRLGVEIGLHKSLVSVRGLALEFAKRFFYKGSNASMAPVAEYWAAKGNLPAALELANKYKLTLPQFLTVMGYGYKAKASVTARVVTLPKRLRNYVVSYYSPAGPGFKGLKEFFALRNVTGSYKINEVKVAALVQSFFKQEIENLLKKLDDLQPLLQEVKTLVTVARDREHYGTKPRGPDRKIIFGDITGWENYYSITDDIKETVYREAFLDVVIRARDLRTKLEELEITSLTWDDFESLLNTVREVSEELGSLPLPRDIYKRREEIPNLKMDFSWTKLWERYSGNFRTTRAS